MKAPIRSWVYAISEPAAEAPVRERSMVRASLAIGTGLLVSMLGVLTPHSRVWWGLEIVWGLSAITLGLAALPAIAHRFWDRFGGLTALSFVTVLVAGTGGLQSRYHLLYILNGLFGAAYYTPRRRLAEAALGGAAFLAPAIYDPGPGTTTLMIGVLTYAVVVTFVSWAVDRLRAAERSRASAQYRYESAFFGSPLPIATLDLRSRFTGVNPALETWSGYSSEEMIGRSFLEFVAPEDVADAEGTFQRAREGKALHAERTIVDAHGRRRRINTTTLPFTDGDVPGVWTLFRDVTGEPTAMESLRASEERYRRLIHNLPATIYLAPPSYYGGDDPLWFISPNVEEWLGYPVRAWLSDSDHWRHVVHPEDLVRVRDDSIRAQSENRPRRLEYRMLAANGDVHWVLDEAHPTPGPTEEDGWVQGILIDITAEKHSEQELGEQVRVQHALTAFASSIMQADGLDVVRKSLEIAADVTRAAAATLYVRTDQHLEPLATSGWPRGWSAPAIAFDEQSVIAEALDEDIADFDPAGPLASNGFRAAIAVPVGGTDERFGVLAVHDHDPRRYNALQRGALQIVAGFVAAALERGATLEETRATQQEASLQAQRLQALVAASPLPILEVDASGRLLAANPSARNLLRLDDANVGDPIAATLPGAGPALHNLIASAIAGRVPSPTEITVSLPNRGDAVLQVYAGPRPAVEDDPDAILFLVDVTEQRALESHVAQAAKMEAVGRLAAGVAHDVNNLLSVIRAYADLARKTDDPVERRADLEGLIETVDEGAELVASLLGLAREDGSQARWLDVHDEVVADRSFYAKALPQGVQLRVGESRGVALARVSPTQLRRMLLNLVTNAAAAMEEGGEIRIEVTSDDGSTIISVIDQGVGMSEVTAARVFEPFFTTRGEGGTGLGMFVVYQLARRYGGRIDIDTEPGNGTSVHVVLPSPSREDPNATEGATPSEQVVAASRARVLLVEDDDRARGLTQRVLQGADHRVTAVVSGEEALEHLRQDRFDALVTDIVLPGMDGLDLVTRARGLQPGIGVVVVSGYASSARLRDGLTGDVDLLSKPFSPQALLRHLDAALDGHQL